MLPLILVSLSLARDPVPDPYVGVSVGGALPAQADAAAATVKAGETVTLRAVLYGGQRAWCMYPEKHAPIGRNTTITHRGMNGCGYQVTTPGYHAAGQWTLTRERYGWTGEGMTIIADKDSQRATLTAPTKPGRYTVSVTGEATWKLDSVAKREVTDRGYGNLILDVVGAPSAVTAAEARDLALRIYQTRIPPGVPRGEGLTWVTSPGFANNVWDRVGYGGYSNTTCGGYQGQVLGELDRMRLSGTEAEKALFDPYDYGPVQAYWGGHQARTTTSSSPPARRGPSIWPG